jgi:dTDP-4-amino-4,6-dideoxygalactose transaminase
VTTDISSPERIRHSASHLLSADFHYIQGLVERNYIGHGPLCDELRLLLMTEFACDDAILTDSGTAALHLCLLALGRQYAGRTRVLVGSYVCPEVIGAVMRAELEPVLVDTQTDSLNIDMADAARQLDTRTLAIICTNIGGMPDDYAAAARLGVPVISDCAQAVGSSVDGRDVTSLGLCAILSFGATKMLSAGGGGAALCRDQTLARAVGRLALPELAVEEYRRSGFTVTYGQHFGDLGAGVAGAQVRRLSALVERRRRIAAAYERVLRARDDVIVPREAANVRSNRFRYYFLSRDASRWVHTLRSRDIEARESISHAIPEYQGNMCDFPGLNAVSRMIVSVPIYPAMSAAHVDAVVAALAAGPG